MFGFPSYRSLLRRIEALESGRKTMELEWELVYEKMRSLMGRLSKRAELDAAREAPAQSEQGEATGADGQPLALSPRQLTLHNQVLRRRKLL